MDPYGNWGLGLDSAAYTVEPHLSNPHLSNLLSQPTNPPPQNMYIFSLFCKAQYEKLYIIMALMVFLLSFNAFLQVKEGI